MTKRLYGLVRLPLLASLALGAALAFVPGRRELALHVYELALATLALAWLVGLVTRTHAPAAESPFDLGLRRPRDEGEPVVELERLEREVSMATTTAFDLHFRLRPRLQRIAAQLLASRRGVDLTTNPTAARRLLGDDAWELVRPDAPAPTDRSGPGVGVTELRATLTALESL